MARIAFAWELGLSFGHAIGCAGLARSLSLRGHAIAFMFRELRQLAVIPESSGYDVFQAPTDTRMGVGEPAPASYADVLLGCGYRETARLAALLGGWRELMRLWRPDLVVADFAPTALLAARSLGIARVTYGNGFFAPPRLVPLPPFRQDAPVDAAHLARSDALALASANSALALFGAAALPTLADMFATDEDFLCTFPELDHYGSRPSSGYWGPRLRMDMGNEVAWPAGNGPRVFVYLQKTLPQLDDLIECLASGPYRVIAWIPGLDPSRRARLAGPGRVALDRPVRIDSVFKGCDLVVSLGGDIAHGGIMFGVPQLVFPQTYEQLLVSHRVEQLGAGGWIAPGAGRESVARALRALTGEARFKAAASAFARRYPAYSPAEQRRRIVQRLEAILAR
jgi:UDP:flavonoid glycosyltransferase YjiC (YdhE family)